MSHSYYNKQLADTQKALDDVLTNLEVAPEKVKPEFDRLTAFQKLATMYVKYILIFRRLEQCYDQIVHPQKRRPLRKILDGVIGRILELKNEMVNLEVSEYHFIDDVMSDLKVTPSDLELSIPKYYTGEHALALMQREKVLSDILQRIGIPPPEPEPVKLKPLSRADAVLLIQMHERARQGRGKAKSMKERFLRESRKKRAAALAETIDLDVAAIRIQRIFRGWSCRRKVQQIKRDELAFLGMLDMPIKEGTISPRSLAAEREVDRRRLQELHEEEYQQALISIKDVITQTEGPDMKTTLIHKIRQWFLECRNALNQFPDYPTVEEGGSLMLFQEKDPVIVDAELKVLDEQKGKKDKDKGKGKDKGKDKKGEKGDKKKGKDKEKDKKKKKGEDEGWLISPSVFVPDIEEGRKIYKDVWAPRQELDNPDQRYDVELIKEEKRSEVEDEIRLQVDELMRQELTNLKMAIYGMKEKKKKAKKKKGKKEKKEKKLKDLTPERTIDSLYEELVYEGIIVRHPYVLLSDYVGNYNYVASTLRQSDIEPMPSLSDVRRVITEYAILPLGSPNVHERGPYVKSILLAGPHGTGKRMLVQAICTETGANLFDLTADNLIAKYPGKAGLRFLVNMVFKVALALQPSVIFIGNCEKMFKKKIPKDDLSDPKRLKKELPKSMKFLRAGHRVLVIGSSSRPFDGDMRPMMNVYHKVILVPRPDYASRYALWNMIIPRHAGTITDRLDLSALAKVSDGYTGAMIDSVCKAVLTDERRLQLDRKPIVANEFIVPLSKIVPVFKEEEEAYPAWFVKTPLGLRKELAVKEAAEIAAERAKEKGKKKK